MTRELPDSSGRDSFAAFVIRTEYGDEQAWEEVAKAVRAPNEFGETRSWIVDDPAWAGASVDDALAAIDADEELRDRLGVVFLADATTMRSADRALLAVTTTTREEVDDEEYEALTEFGRTFRTAPAGIHDIHVNLELANMGFEEFASAAAENADKVYRAAVQDMTERVDDGSVPPHTWLGPA